MFSIKPYFFNNDAWKTLWNLMWVGNAISYATGPLLTSISKGPQNLGANLPHLPKLNKLCFDFTFK